MAILRMVAGGSACGAYSIALEGVGGGYQHLQSVPYNMG